jgi:hypothetical protein
MPVTEEMQEKGSGSGAKKAVTAAAAAAATGAATYAVKRMRSSNGDSNGERSSNNSGDGSQSIIRSAALSGWDAASDALLPMAENAAESAGKYLATRGPELVKERIVPKFIEAFNDAK